MEQPQLSSSPVRNSFLNPGELLKESKQFIDDGMHPQIIIKGFRLAL
jgi:hypothetical protein